MPKYRFLNPSELQQFEKEFIDFLIVNGIDASGWEKLKEEDKDKAERIVELFSDVVFEKIMRKTTYLFNYSGNTVFALKYLEDKAQLFLVEVFGESPIEACEDALVKAMKENPAMAISRFQEKSYKTERELEMFRLMEAGALVSDGHLFEYLLESQSN